MKIDALVVEAIDAPFERAEVELAEPAANEVRVRLVASGVCHTDAITQHGDLPMPMPAVLGHEGAGVVDAVGADVEGLEVGDHVVMGWPFCGVCRNCLEGEPRYCLRIGEAVGSGHRVRGPGDGTSGYSRAGGEVNGHFFGQSSFATHSLADAAACVKVPKDADLATLGPLACGIATGAGAVLNNAELRPGSSLVVFGAGAVGLAAIMAAQSTPATTIIAVDLNDDRLALAERYGATHTINSGSEDARARVLEICGGTADVAIDCTGVIAVIELAADVVGLLGTLLLIGGAPAGARFSLDHVSALWGKRIQGTLGGSSTSQRLIPALIELNRQGRFPYDELIAYYDFDEIDRALADSKSGVTIKPVLRIGAQ